MHTAATTREPALHDWTDDYLRERFAGLEAAERAGALRTLAGPIFLKVLRGELARRAAAASKGAAA